METVDSLLNPSESIDNQLSIKSNEDIIIQKENQRFTKHSALVTLLIMSIGPFSLVVQAIGEVVDMLMITKRFQNDKNSHAIEILGFTGQVCNILGYLGLYFGQALTTRISSLIGSGDRENASHLVSDIIYLCVLTSCIFVAAFVFAVKPFLTFLGVPRYMLNDTFKYLVPTLVALPFTNLTTLTQYFFTKYWKFIFNVFSQINKLCITTWNIFTFVPFWIKSFNNFHETWKHCCRNNSWNYIYNINLSRKIQSKTKFQ